MVRKRNPWARFVATECSSTANPGDSPFSDRVEAAGRVFWFGLAIALAAWGAWMGARQLLMRNWPSTKAVILQASVTDTGDSWFPQVEYAYSVCGIEHKSSMINPSPFNYNKGQADEYHADFDTAQIGATVRCWYNPANPAESYLSNHGLSTGPALVCIAGIALLLFAIFPPLRRKRLRRP